VSREIPHLVLRPSSYARLVSGSCQSKAAPGSEVFERVLKLGSPSHAIAELIDLLAILIERNCVTVTRELGEMRAVVLARLAIGQGNGVEHLALHTLNRPLLPFHLAPRRVGQMLLSKCNLPLFAGVEVTDLSIHILESLNLVIRYGATHLSSLLNQPTSCRGSPMIISRTPAPKVRELP
jgi:hypothetical protein